jgi:putative ABC transport system ATP-binding protein
MNLSGGQRQRIALARALLADRTVLVLRDPTTAVDAVTENAIATGIRRLRHHPSSPADALLGAPTRAVHHVRDSTEECVTESEVGERPRSTVLITTSPPLLGSCDRVLFLADGGAVEGTHAELLERSDYAAAVLR